MGRRTIQVINVIQVTIAQPSLGLIDGITSLLQVGWSHTWVILDEHLVLGMGHIEVTPKTKTISKGLVELYFPLITCGTNFTQVGCWRRTTEIRRNGTLITTYQDVVTNITEDIEGTCNQTTQETVVSTNVQLLNCLPLHVFIADGSLTIPSIDTLVVLFIHDSVATVCPLAHIQPTVAIEEWVTQIVITNLTV